MRNDSCSFPQCYIPCNDCTKAGNIEYWHWMYHHFDQEVDDGPRFIAEMLWMEVVLVGGALALWLVI